MATHESADLQAALNGDLGGIPFRTELSLKPVTGLCTGMGGRGSPTGAVARAIADQVAKVSELLAPLTDCTVVERHAELLDVLMAAAIPPASRDHAYAAAMVPFQLHGFYATPPMERLLMTEDWRLKGRINLDAPMVGPMRRAYAYAPVLQRLYGVGLGRAHPLILSVPDPERGFDGPFRSLF